MVGWWLPAAYVKYLPVSAVSDRDLRGEYQGKSSDSAPEASEAASEL